MVPVRINRDVSVLHPGTPIIILISRLIPEDCFGRFFFCEPFIVIGCLMVVFLKK